MNSTLKRIIFILMTAIVALPSFAREITRDDADMMLRRLDSEIAQRHTYLRARQHHIDSLCRLIDDRVHDRAWMDIIEDIGDAFTAYDNDSVLVYFTRGLEAARNAGEDSLIQRFSIKRAVYLSLAGLSSEALLEFDAINGDSILAVGGDCARLYLDSKRQLHSYLVASFRNYAPLRMKHQQQMVEAQRRLLAVLDTASLEYRFNLGEYYFNTGDLSKAKVLLGELIDRVPEDNKFYARAANKMSEIAKARGENDAYIYYLAMSAIGDVRSATREVSSLQALGRELFTLGDADRAYLYLSIALENAVNCHAASRMLESAESMPIIAETHKQQMESRQVMLFTALSIMAVLLILLVAAMLYLRRDMKRLDLMRRRLEDANHVKEFYITQFLNLSSIYMDKLNEFCKIANRKISTGNVDDLYKLTRSGKFVDEQSREFYEVFDNAFLHLYPTFIKDVNALLREDSRQEIAPGEQLNTDLRILALMRLGLDDCGHIARVLNYSVNTIYAYRNKLRNRAINRETFESDLMSIGRIH